MNLPATICKTCICIKYFIFLVLVLLVSSLLNHGSLGGDEGKIVEISSHIVNSSLTAFEFLTTTKSDALLQNHLAWVSITSLNIFIVNNLNHFFSINITPMVWNWIIAYPPALAAICSALIIFKALRRDGSDTQSTIIAILLIYLCTPISSFLTGGWSECYLLLLISIRILIIRNNITLANLILLGVIDSSLIFFKAYSIFFVAIASPIFIRKISLTNKISYFFTVCLILALILSLKLNMHKEFDSQNIFGPNFEIPDLNVYTTRLSDALISLDFGVLTMPPFIILLLCINKFRKESNFYLTCIAFLTTIIFLCLYPFWHGALGIAGQRYISPFIIFFAPYITIAVRFTIHRFPKIIYVIFLLLFLYIPTLNYRNTLIDVYANLEPDSLTNKYFAHTNFPTNNPYFHPALFASSISIKKNLLADSNIIISNKNSYTVYLEPAKIIPMTGISRILLLQSGSWQGLNKDVGHSIKNIPFYPLIAIFILLYSLPFLLLIYALNVKKNENL